MRTPVLDRDPHLAAASALLGSALGAALALGYLAGRLTARSTR